MKQNCEHANIDKQGYCLDCGKYTKANWVETDGTKREGCVDCDKDYCKQHGVIPF